MICPRTTRNVIVRVRSTFVLPDERLVSESSDLIDLEYNEEVLLTGIAIANKKRDVESRYVADAATTRIILQHEQEVESLKQQVTQLKHQLSEALSAASTMFESGRKSGREDFDERYQHISEHLQSVSENVNYIAQVYNRQGGNPVELGVQGETFVESQLRSMFRQDRIEVTSKKAAQADLKLYRPNHTFLIEAKNVKRLVDTDLTKFYRDIEANSGEIDAAVFISLKDIVLVHGYSSTHFEIVKGIPVLYVGGVLECPRAMEFGIRMLEQILNSGMCKDKAVSESSDYFQQVAFKCASRLLTNFYNEQANIAKDKKILGALFQQITTREKAHQDYKQYQDELNEIFPNLREVAKSVVLDTSTVTVGPGDRKNAVLSKQKVLDWLRNNGSRRTTLREIVAGLNLKGNWCISNLGGLAALKDEAFGPDTVENNILYNRETSEAVSPQSSVASKRDTPTTESPQSPKDTRAINHRPKNISPQWDPELRDMLKGTACFEDSDTDSD